MAEYIEREALINWAKEFYPNDKHFVSGIMNAPAADAVEVVRCKECKYFLNDCCNHIKNRFIHKVPYFGAHYVYIAKLEVKSDDFCSYGERKDG